MPLRAAFTAANDRNLKFSNLNLNIEQLIILLSALPEGSYDISNAKSQFSSF